MRRIKYTCGASIVLICYACIDRTIYHVVNLVAVSVSSCNIYYDVAVFSFPLFVQSYDIELFGSLARLKRYWLSEIVIGARLSYGSSEAVVVYGEVSRDSVVVGLLGFDAVFKQPGSETEGSIDSCLDPGLDYNLVAVKRCAGAKTSESL